jgi:hypothetical protein
MSKAQATADEWKPAESIDAIRDELRRAIWGTAFGGTMHKINQDAAMHDLCQQRSCAFAHFGVEAGLIAPDEANEWMDGIWGKTAMGLIVLKYCGDEDDKTLARAAIAKAQESP